MYGRGNLEDAKELQASFTRAQAPRRNNRGGRGRGRGNADGGRRGGAPGNARPQPYQQGRGGGAQDHPQQTPYVPTHAREDAGQPHRRPAQQADDLTLNQQSAWETTSGWQNVSPSYMDRVHQGQVPSPAGSGSPENFQKRIASSEQDANATKRVKGERAEEPAQARAQDNSRPSLFRLGQQSRPSITSPFAPATREPHPPLYLQSSWGRPDSQHQTPTGFRSSISADTPMPPATPAPQRWGPVPPENHDSGMGPSEPSLLDEEVEAIGQPVMPYTVGGGSQRDEDVAMGGVEASSNNNNNNSGSGGNSRPVLRGLAASRWNTENAWSSGNFPGEPMLVDPPAQERRGALAPAGSVVTSGTSKGPGLANSRWAS